MDREADDARLLQRYAEERCEDAFAELVRRHVNLVYGCALRRVGGDAQLAEDVTQQVFSALAREAAALARHRVLGGWLFTTTRFIAAQTVRTERRRQRREQEAHTMSELTTDSAPDPDWQRLRPVLDDTIEQLEERDREAVVLRFFEGRSFAEVGARLQLTENAARMRVERALDKLHALLARRGVRSTSAALGLALAGQASMAAPAGLAASVTATVLAGGAAGVGISSAVGGGSAAAATSFMSMTKLQLALCGALAAAGATGFVVQANTNEQLRDEVARLRRETTQLATLQTENLQLARTAVETAEMRRDDVEFARLQTEAETLRTQLRQVARAAEARTSAAQTLAQLDRTPKPRLRMRPQFPAAMREAGIGGEVMVDFIVDQNGDVVSAQARGSTRPEFEAPALAAVSGWKFDAGRKSNRAVTTRMQVPIVFSIAGTERTPAQMLKDEAPAATREAFVRMESFFVETER